MSARNVGLAAVLVCVLILSSKPSARASHDLFAYKLPCVPDDACYITQFYSASHSAYDIDPRGGDGVKADTSDQGLIVAVSEGLFDAYYTSATQCTWPNSTQNQRAGMYARVYDMHGRSVIYAHLSEFGSLQQGQRLLQGDIIGIEGNTGNSEDCNPHLHLGLDSNAPGFEGIPAPSLALQYPYHSTNSVVGAYNAPGAAIRTEYFDLGSVYTSWAVVGWTSDWLGTGLYTQYFPDPVAGHWGSKQDFRTHPDGAGFEYTSIMTGRWAVNDAFVVEKPFYVNWLLDGEHQSNPSLRYAIGPPLSGKVGSFPGLCEAAAGCVEYQKFHVGFIWKHQTQGYKAEFRPDVPSGSPAVRDGVVAVADINAVVKKFGATETEQPFEPWPDAAVSILGEGTISVGDISTVVGAFGPYCRVTA